MPSRAISSRAEFWKAEFWKARFRSARWLSYSRVIGFVRAITPADPGAALGDQAGAALIELAVSLPLMALTLIGAAELGRVAYYSIEVSSAAYSGASFAAQNHGTAVDTTDIVAAATKDAANVPGLSTTAGISCVCSSGTAITCANAAVNCPSPARISEFVQVNTSAAVNPMFSYPGISASWPLSASATIQVEQ